ncbi:MAG: YvcK family protein [Candidatus Berkelbacteria bacterium]|nr:YvcK family protein [Candidatus Berkelbacteria bacterium]
MDLRKNIKKWWLSIAYDPADPRYGRGEIKIVAIGGGTGISNLLRGLKKYSRDITAVVAMSDAGKSSGVIRKVFKTLPPGDIRKCLAALSDEYQLLSEVFEYRFPSGSDFLSGHPLGNIWLAALIQKYGSFEKAIDVSHHLLDIVGNVYPSTLDNVQLVAKFEDGKQITGEDKIPLAGKRIKRVFFNKAGVRAYRKAVVAINDADLIIIGPGSLYTSVIPNLLVPGIASAIKGCRAAKLFVANCSTERGETEEMTIPDHIQTVENHAGKDLFDYVLVNNKILRRSKMTSKLGEVNNITYGEKNYHQYKIICCDLIDRKLPLYHDRDKLAKEIILLYNSVKESK